MYSKEAILNMIGTHKIKCNVLADAMPEYDSNSIAQYGIQSTLPKPQGENGSKVEDVVIKLEKSNKRYTQMLEEIEFINRSQQKLGTVDFCFLELLKKGYNRESVISKMPNSKINRNNFLTKRDELAEKIYLLQ
ncbi:MULTISPECIES: hypothetical protein [Staphylococcus intermedius group]|uniref:Putative phi PVL-like protein n=1 Tax=Staphylococcus intermedius NCTC 11048 TaxID=1141106 RepID=A0A380GAE8_STAIN|nr:MULTISPECIES: hypothetical protein [Staphylococcus intermedius group]PCF88614.1 hypothetical protein B4W75_07540 [Staphylococcus intermedius]PNZ49048.1 hypothetical protein CD138_13255 [Staphylococcus intermedius NCTC 11048]UXS22600.1 hypothetical protein MUA22_05185 [Staphylococcus delphini]UXS43753.1 hypothetical protein MUA39_10360 [Staphylococcus delphini]UXS58539.1 hypothetical protein MUA44_05175 [Staphylococcus delphini]